MQRIRTKLGPSVHSWTRGAAAAALLLAVACGGPEAPPPPDAAGDGAPVPEEVLKAAQSITAPTLREVVAALADDAMEGRGPASPGDVKARDYIAQQLEQLGLKPAGPDGCWQQPFDVVSVHAKAPETWEFTTPKGPESFKWWDDYIAASGVQEPQSVIDNAEVVFVGYGIVAPEYQWNDYKGQDLHGKVLLMLNNDPDWDPALFEGDRRLYYGRWVYKYESAAAQGAAGAIIIHTTPSAGYPFQVVQSSWTGPQFELPAEGEPRVQVAAWLSYPAAERLVAAAGLKLEDLEQSAHSRDFQPVPLGVTTSLRLTNEVARTQTANVLGLLEGSDPQLKDQVVVYTAHHDHLGVGEPNAAGDTIYNGARDNAAGVAQVLDIARAFQALPKAPRRSVLFLMVGTEEQGLLGSEYYALHPTFPPGKIAANINFDAPGIWGRTKDMPLVGKGKSDLDDVAARIAAYQGRDLISEPDPTQGSFYRSDQFNFAKIGVPALYFGEGVELEGAAPGEGKKKVDDWNETHYHQPSDELTDDWNFDGIVEDTQAGFYAGWIVANQDAMPAWKPGDEFEAKRKEALAAVGP